MKLLYVKEIWLFFLTVIVSVEAVGQNVHIIYTGEPVQLIADGRKHGTINWQRSYDNITWIDLPGWNSDTINFIPDTTITYYRAKISSGTCDYIYSNFEAVKLFQCGDTIIDYRDGRAYPTVQIGTQCWMGKNMNVGTMIYGVHSMQDNNIIEKYCYFNDTVSCNTYGALYQWGEMMQYIDTPGTQGICPKGWHIPTDQEFITMELALGMTLSDANLMNTWRGTDQGTKILPGGISGFEANLTGIRYDGGLFYNEGTFEYLYTSNTTPGNPNAALRRCLSAGSTQIGRFNNTFKTVGGSVRCIKSD